MIFDTNALSAFADGQTSVVSRAAQATQVAIPVIVLGEFRFGIAQSRTRTTYEEWLQETLRRSAVLDIDEKTTVHYASIRLELKRAGAPIPQNDLWIAALCRQGSLPLLSRDSHFDHVSGLERVKW